MWGASKVRRGRRVRTEFWLSLPSSVRVLVQAYTYEKRSCPTSSIHPRRGYHAGVESDKTRISWKAFDRWLVDLNQFPDANTIIRKANSAFGSTRMGE